MAGEEQVGWWVVKFNIHWEEVAGKPPEKHLDLFILDRIIKPTLRECGDGLEMWQIHRRYNRDYFDHVGHEFELRIRCAPKLGGEIIKAIKAHRDTKRLKRAKLLNFISHSKTAKNPKPRLEDISDKSWPTEFQSVWPYFAQGACDSLLRLVEHFADIHCRPQKRQNVKAEAEQYKMVATEVDKIWHDLARRGFFHHLNAIYGYAPFRLENAFALAPLARF